MNNTPNAEPLKSAEYFALMRLLQTLETQGGIPGSDQFNWQEIYDKLNHQCCESRKAVTAEIKPRASVHWAKAATCVALDLEKRAGIVGAHNVERDAAAAAGALNQLHWSLDNDPEVEKLGSRSSHVEIARGYFAVPADTLALNGVYLPNLLAESRDSRWAVIGPNGRTLKGEAGGVHRYASIEEATKDVLTLINLGDSS